MNTFQITSHLRTAFRKIGTDVRAVAPRPRPWRLAPTPPVSVRVQGGVFELTLPAGGLACVLDCRKDERHLLLSLQAPRAAAERFLCGFDERHWFVAGVTASSSVPAAKESLIPAAVRQVILRSGLRHADRFRRRTSAFLRQGEWFFVPTETTVNPLNIHRHEPLIRPGGGKAHVVDELVRGVGEMVWHHQLHAPAGVTDAQFRALPEAVRTGKGWSQRLRVAREGSVLARGAVRHPDHATVYLPTWHRVFINNKQRPASLGFLD